MKNIFTFLALFMFNSSSALSLDLSNASICDGNPSSKSQTGLDAGKIISEVYKNNSMRVGRCLGWTNMNEGNLWYDVTNKMQVYSINVDSRNLLGHWPLISNETCPTSQVCNSVWWQGRWSKDELFEPEVIERFYNYEVSMRPVYNSNVKTLGCLGDAPLKYGDVDGNGENELVMYIENSLIIFSPQLHKTIFMSMIDVKDWYTQSQTISHLSERRMDGAPLELGDPQFQSRLATFVRGGDHSNLPGYRGYAKLFFEDFDGDEKADIIVWRKLYESRLVGDPIHGFKKLRDTLAYYKLIGGEYALQKAESTELREWLSDRQLLWSDGFPSISECESEKGQLIPEMHDPLLNDSDVLEPIPTPDPTP